MDWISAPLLPRFPALVTVSLFITTPLSSTLFLPPASLPALVDLTALPPLSLRSAMALRLVFVVKFFSMD